MKKRIISFVLSLAILTSLLPIASAADEAKTLAYNFGWQYANDGTTTAGIKVDAIVSKGYTEIDELTYTNSDKWAFAAHNHITSVNCNKNLVNIGMSKDEVENNLAFVALKFSAAEGTYIQGKPNYTNVTDVSTIFTEDELKEIQKLLGDKYETMFEWVIEMGETEEYSLTEGTLWKAYYPPYGAVWCNILIYNDGSIYIEGSYWEKGYWFYSNTDATEMPDIEN